MTVSKQSVLNDFIIEIQLVAPITKIVSQLNNNEFRDCDIKWLDSKLSSFIEIAATTLSIPTATVLQSETIKPKYMGGYAIQYYSKYFKTLLDYFKGL